MPRLDHTAASKAIDVLAEFSGLLHTDKGALQDKRADLIAACAVGYAKSTELPINPEDYLVTVAEFLDPENFDFTQWCAGQDSTDLDYRGLKS